MESKEQDQIIFVRLFSDENLFNMLEKVCQKHNVKTAVVLSGLGQLKKFKLGYFVEKNNYSPQEFTDPHELISLTGNIGMLDNEKYEFHLHASLGNKNKETVSGHLIDGTVEITNEIVLLKTDIEIKREIEDKTGLKGLFLE